jgi:hypothetical protein
METMALASQVLMEMARQHSFHVIDDRGMFNV